MRSYHSVLEKYGAVEVTPMEMYSDIFKIGEGYIQKNGERRQKESDNYKGNPIGYWKNKNAEKGHFRIFFEDTFEEQLKELQDADWSLLGGVSYFGRRPLSDHADKLFAMIIDLDEVYPDNLNNFFSGAFAKIYPIPTYIVLSKSGKGVHLYYVLEEPVSLFPNIRLQLKELKYAITNKIWNQYTSKQEKVEYQGIYQRFRVAGAKCDEGVDDERCRCFRVTTHPTSIEEMNRCVSSVIVFDEKKRFKESKMTLEEAKIKYPEWYNRVVVNKNNNPKKWDIQGKVHGDNPFALYDWWKRKIKEGASVGHRYFCIMALVIYGVRNNVPYEKLEKDCLELIPFMNEVNPEEPFTEQDVYSALECYDDRYCTFPNRDISRLTTIDIVPNKRNGRKQNLHLRLARANRDILCEERGKKDWREGNGRPNKQKIVEEWLDAHPEGTKAECIRETGLSKPTVYKWWNPQNIHRDKN